MNSRSREVGDSRNCAASLPHDCGPSRVSAGTFDVSLLMIEDNYYSVSATNGDTHLGGEDFDNRLIHFCLSKMQGDTMVAAASLLPGNLNRLRQACEQAKIRLSSSTEVHARHSGPLECVLAGLWLQCLVALVYADPPRRL